MRSFKDYYNIIRGSQMRKFNQKQVPQDTKRPGNVENTSYVPMNGATSKPPVHQRTSTTEENVYCDVGDNTDKSKSTYGSTYEKMDVSGQPDDMDDMGDPEYEYHNPGEDQYTKPVGYKRQATVQETYQQLSSWVTRKTQGCDKIYWVSIVISAVIILILLVSLAVLGLRYRECSTLIAPLGLSTTMDRMCEETTGGGMDCYYIYNTPVTLERAQEICREVSGELVQLRSLGQVDQVAGLLPVRTDFNVASKSKGATCTNSSSWDESYSCVQAITGDVNPGPGDWVTQEDQTPEGSWIMVNFSMPFDVHSVAITSRCRTADQISGFTLDFGDDTSYILHGSQQCYRGNKNRNFCPLVTSELKTFDSIVTSSIKLTFTSTCYEKVQYTGLREIQVIGNTAGFWINQSNIPQSLWLITYNYDGISINSGTTEKSCFALYPTGVKGVVCGKNQRRPVICADKVTE